MTGHVRLALKTLKKKSVRTDNTCGSPHVPLSHGGSKTPVSSCLFVRFNPMQDFPSFVLVLELKIWTFLGVPCQMLVFDFTQKLEVENKTIVVFCQAVKHNDGETIQR